MRHSNTIHRILLASLFIGTSTTGISQPLQAGPSFDCAKARSKSELIICSDRELSRLDLELSAIYSAAKATAENPAEFQKQAAAEWKAREQTCVDRACVVQWYQKRKLQLTAMQKPEPKPLGTVRAAPESRPIQFAPSEWLCRQETSARTEKYSFTPNGSFSTLVAEADGTQGAANGSYRVTNSLLTTSVERRTLLRPSDAELRDPALAQVARGMVGRTAVIPDPGWNEYRIATQDNNSMRLVGVRWFDRQSKSISDLKTILNCQRAQ